MPPIPYDEALDRVRRCFPGHEVTICDGDHGQESGVVEGPDGTSVSSFRLTIREPRDAPPLVKKVRVGEVGQYCGTSEEIRAWTQAHSEPVYLDYNATTPLDPRVLEVMLPWFLTPSNAGSRTHSYGQKAKEAVETARKHIA